MYKRRMCSHCGSYILSLKAKSFHGASCRVTAHRQRELLCVMAFQEMEWASIDEVNTEDFDLSNITDDELKMNSVLQSLLLMKSFQSGLMKLRTQCIALELSFV